MFSHVSSKNGQKAPLIADDVFHIVMQVSHSGLLWIRCHSFVWLIQIALQLTCPLQSVAQVYTIADMNQISLFFICRTLNALTARLYTIGILTTITLDSRRVTICRCMNPCRSILGSLTGLDGAQTLERSYLLRINGTIVERPQHMLMRVAIGIHKQVI